MIPVVAVTKDGDRGDPVVPALGGVIGQAVTDQGIYVVVEPYIDAAEVIVVEETQAGSAKDADRRDAVIESVRQRWPAIAFAHAEVVSTEVRISKETCAGPRKMRTTPAPLRDCG